MPDLEIIRIWEHLNRAGGATAGAIKLLQGHPTNKAKGNALLLLHEARRQAIKSASNLDAQILQISTALQSQKPRPVAADSIRQASPQTQPSTIQ